MGADTFSRKKNFFLDQIVNFGVHFRSLPQYLLHLLLAILPKKNSPSSFQSLQLNTPSSISILLKYTSLNVPFTQVSLAKKNAARNHSPFSKSLVVLGKRSDNAAPITFPFSQYLIILYVEIVMPSL